MDPTTNQITSGTIGISQNAKKNKKKKKATTNIIHVIVLFHMLIVSAVASKAILIEREKCDAVIPTLMQR